MGQSNGGERWGVVGPGAMGLMHAAYLHQAGLDITLIDHRPERSRQLRQGFRLQRDPAAGGDLQLRLPCQMATELQPPFDLLLFTVKAWATATAAAQVATLVGPDTVLVSLQNGLGNVEILQQYQRPERVLAAVTTSGATRLAADVISQRASGTLQLGSVGGNRELAQRVARQFASAGLPAEAVDDIAPILWSKLTVNSAINPLTALLDLPNGQLPRSPAARLSEAVARESVSVARAAGVELDPEVLAELVVRVCHETADNSSSMRQDFAARRPTEISQINGAVVQVAARAGAEAPLNRALTDLVQAHEWRWGQAFEG